MASHRVRLRHVLRGVLKTLPRAPYMARALPQLLEYPPRPYQHLGSVVEATAKRFPHRPAIWFQGEVTTWKELNERANQLASALYRRGVRNGGVVGLYATNRPETLALVTGCAKLGAITALLNTAQRGTTLDHSLAAARVQLCIVEDELKNAFGENASESFETLINDAQTMSNSAPPDTQVSRAQPAFYIFTSGTTGLPKASIMSHRRWMKASYGYGFGMLSLRAEDVVYNPLPLYHNLAQTIAWGSCAATGACLALAPKFSATRFWDDCRASSATVITYIGEIPRYLLAQAPSPGDRAHSVRAATGVGLRTAIWDEFKTRFGIEQIAEFYGSSEGNTVFLNLLGLDHTVGFSPTPHVLVEWDATQQCPRKNAQGRLIPVKRGEPGLLLSRITKRFPYDGYTDPGATEKRLYHNPFGKNRTYMDSGDLLRKVGYGHSVFVDRVGDTFRWKGENVATAQVEGVLNRFPGVQESTVYGISRPNVDGKPGMAAIACNPQSLDISGLYAHCRADLPEYAVPMYLRLQTALQHTGTFKHERYALRELGLQQCPDSLLLGRSGDHAWAPL